MLPIKREKGDKGQLCLSPLDGKKNLEVDPLIMIAKLTQT
jgi:hypothetical protein